VTITASSGDLLILLFLSLVHNPLRPWAIVSIPCPFPLFLMGIVHTTRLMHTAAIRRCVSFCSLSFLQALRGEQDCFCLLELKDSFSAALERFVIRVAPSGHRPPLFFWLIGQCKKAILSSRRSFFPTRFGPLFLSRSLSFNIKRRNVLTARSILPGCPACPLNSFFPFHSDRMLCEINIVAVCGDIPPPFSVSSWIVSGMISPITFFSCGRNPSCQSKSVISGPCFTFFDIREPHFLHPSAATLIRPFFF